MTWILLIVLYPIYSGTAAATHSIEFSREELCVKASEQIGPSLSFGGRYNVLLSCLRKRDDS